MSGTTWSHLLARLAVRPLIGTPVKPNHLTTLRLVSGLVACAALALGTRPGMLWGGALWIVSTFLDRADGELARIGNMMSPEGHAYDYLVDNVVNAALFVAIGIGLRESWLGWWAIPMGAVTSVSLCLSGWWAELLERRSEPGTKAYSGMWGVDPDDLLYLIGPLAWFGWLAPVLIGACVVGPLMTIITGLRLRWLIRTSPIIE